jgi:diaminopimelate epimerase
MAQRDERGGYVVDVPGGTLRVDWTDGGTVLLTGPAVLVATGDYQGDG